MSGNLHSENGGMPLQIAITIPGSGDNGGCGASLRSLLEGAGADLGGANISLVISDVQPGLDPDAERAGIVFASPRRGVPIASSDFTDHGRPVAAGAPWYDPARRSIDLYVRSLSTSPVPALAIIYP